MASPNKLSTLLSLGLLLGSLSHLNAETISLPQELSVYALNPAPQTQGLILKKGDRLAICGDSITEQKQYSVIIESYLTAAYPELEISSRQYGWSGEQAGGFYQRLENDVLRFQPTIATTCYGMNDFRYVPFEEQIGETYRDNLTKIAHAFKAKGTRLIVGSSGIIDSVPHWVKSAKGTKQDLNLSLSKMRNIALDVAKKEEVYFADVYTPMLLADLEAKKKHGDEFQVAGKDGVHPEWSGQLIMAYAFLKSMGLDGDLGSIVYDETSGRAEAVNGHQVLGVDQGKISLRSSKIPFYAEPGDISKQTTLAAGRALVPFDQDLNRFTLKIKHPKAQKYRITWGNESKEVSAEALQKGINLATEFSFHPLANAFQAIWKAVAEKQAYETHQIKAVIHGEEGKANMEEAFKKTEAVRAEKVKAVQDAIQPVEHMLQIEALP